MSLIHPLKFRTWETGHFKTPRLQTSRLQTGVFQTVVAVAFEHNLKAIYIRLADMVYPDGNIIKASAGLCHYANYERLRD